MNNFIRIIIASAAIAGSLSAQANHEQNNPRHPAYFANKVTIAEIAGDGERYVDNRNPRHPAFGKTAGEWMETAGRSITPYVDSRNPLHPSFQR